MNITILQHVTLLARFYLMLATLLELFHPCYLSNVKQR